MEKERRIKTLSIMALIVAVLGLTVAFAALSQQLTINGAAKISQGSWDVHFENVSSPNKIGDAVADAATIEATTITIPQVTFKKPGDTVIYTFDVVNGGTIDAKVSSVPVFERIVEATASDTTDNANDKLMVENNLIFTLTYENGSEIVLDDKLSSSNTKKMKLTIGYKENATSIPTNDVNITNLKVTFTYGQD